MSDLEQYESVKRWFSARRKPYTKRTQHTYLLWLKVWCDVLHLNPDELAKAEPVETQARLVNAMLDDLHYKEYTVGFEMRALHQFWAANGAELTDDVMKFKGCERLKRRNPNYEES
jgi:hypothetical protein